MIILVVFIAVFVAGLIHVSCKEYLWGDFRDSNPYLIAKWQWPDGTLCEDPPPSIAHRFFVSHNAFDSPRENFKLKFGSKWDTREYSLRKKFVALDIVMSLAGGLVVLWFGCKLIY